jgi:hypothetical protein
MKKLPVLIVLYAAIVMIIAAACNYIACSPVPQTDFNRSMDSAINETNSIMSKIDSAATYQYNHSEAERGE